MNRRSFLKSALAGAAAPLLSSSGTLSAIEAIAGDLAAEAKALWQANHNAVLDSAFGESSFHMQMLNHWNKAGYTLTSMIDKIEQLQKRLESLKAKGHDFPELEESLASASSQEESEGIDVTELEKLIAQAEENLAIDNEPETDLEVAAADVPEQVKQGGLQPARLAL